MSTAGINWRYGHVSSQADEAAGIVISVDRVISPPTPWMDAALAVDHQGVCPSSIGPATSTSVDEERFDVPQQRVGRCLCAKTPLKSTIKKRTGAPATAAAAAAAGVKVTAAAGATATAAVTNLRHEPKAAGQDAPPAHIVPQVQVFVSSANRAEHNSQASTQTQASVGVPAVTLATYRKVSRSTNTYSSGHQHTNEPVLTKVGKNWNHSMDVVGGHNHQENGSNLQRCGSQQSCKSAATVRSVTSTSRSRTSATAGNQITNLKSPLIVSRKST